MEWLPWEVGYRDYDKPILILFKLMIQGSFLLVTLLATPLLGMATLCGCRNLGHRVHRVVAAATLGAMLVLCVAIALCFTSNTGAGNPRELFQMVEKLPWLHLKFTSTILISADFHVGVDGFSLPLVLLCALLFSVSVLSHWDLKKHSFGYYLALLFLAFSVMGVLLALDFFLFFVFFDLVLIPSYFLIGIWGKEGSGYAALKFFIFTFLGSLAILSVLIFAHLEFVGVTDGAWNMLEWTKPGLQGEPRELGTFSLRDWMFFALLLGFCIKMAAVPVHWWLGDAHVSAPFSISILLAGILLKIGPYGLLRIGYTLFPREIILHKSFLMTLGLVTLLYGAFIALGQKNLKRLIAFSSIFHMGLILVGLSRGTPEGLLGSVFHMVSHGIIAGLLFVVAAEVESRTKSLDIDKMGGLYRVFPKLAIVASVAFFANLGLPGLSGFVGELLVLLSVFGGNPGWEDSAVGLAVIGGILICSAYCIWTLHRVFFGPLWHPQRAGMQEYGKDLGGRQLAIVVPLVLLIFLLGVFPGILTSLMEESVGVWHLFPKTLGSL